MDIVAMVLFGISIGILLCYLGGVCYRFGSKRGNGCGVGVIE